MKILITGGAGFIGSHIVEDYLDKGHRVWVLDDESSGHRRQVPKKANFMKGDVTDKSKLSNLFKRIRFDVVNHHAAQIDVRRSVSDPAFDAKVNIMGLLNVLALCVETKVKKVIFSSSGGTVYGECRKPANETFPEVPLSPYGVAKLASEKYIQAFRALHGLMFTVFRYSNVYGPRQDPHGEAGVVAIFSNKILNQETAKIFGDGKQTRDFVFVKDVATANGLALTKGHNQIINIGTGIETSVTSLYKEMAKLGSFNMRPVYEPARMGELRRSVLDCGKAARVLGWTPEASLKQGLAQTMAFFAEKLSMPFPI